MGASRCAVRCVPNQTGFGQARNGARITVFSTRENIKVLCTTSVPEPMSLRVFPGKAPHGVITVRSSNADLRIRLHGWMQRIREEGFPDVEQEELFDVQAV